MSVPLRHIATSAIVAIGLIVGLATPALALQENESNTTDTQTTDSQSKETEPKTTDTQPQAKETEAASETEQEGSQGKLNTARERVCAQHSATITRIVSNAAAEGQRQLNLFSDIANKVEQFYTNKKLSAANYTQDVAAIASKKDAAQTAVNTVKNAGSFSCNGTNPIGQVALYKSQVSAMHQALKDLRTAVKTLIVDVKSAAAQGGVK